MARIRYLIILVFSLIILLVSGNKARAEGGDEVTLPERVVDFENGIWYGLYTKYMIADKLFYYGEYHMRRSEWNTHMSKLYLRFGLSYLINPHLEITAGFVNPYSWYQIDDKQVEDHVVPEFRFWQQFLFVQEIARLKLYHQFRFEERWKRGHLKGEDYHYSQRYRYKFSIYTPLNHNHIQNKTIFLSNNAEIFLQSGEPIIYNHLEEVRIFNGIGYLLNNNIQFQLGYSWHFAHRFEGYKFRRQDIIRFSVYHNMDLRSK